MSKRWSLNIERPRPSPLGFGNFDLVTIAGFWRKPYIIDGYPENGAISLTVVLLGFGLTVTRWIEPDVYGDGGVA